MAFRFSLQGLLRLRLSYERREWLRLQAATQHSMQLRLRVEALAEAQLAAGQCLVQGLGEGMSGAEIHFVADRLAARARLQQELARRLAEAELQRLQQLAVFQQVQRQRKILDNLRDRQLQAYRQAEARREQQRLDEMFLLRRRQPGPAGSPGAGAAAQPSAGQHEWRGAQGWRVAPASVVAR